MGESRRRQGGQPVLSPAGLPADATDEDLIELVQSLPGWRTWGC